jgi:hypothetical protein
MSKQRINLSSGGRHKRLSFFPDASLVENDVTHPKSLLPTWQRKFYKTVYPGRPRPAAHRAIVSDTDTCPSNDPVPPQDRFA